MTRQGSLILAVLVLLVHGTSVAAQDSAGAPRDAATASGRTQEYVVGPLDLLAVTVWNQPRLSGQFDVQADGTVNLPLVGRVKVGGLTRAGAEAALAARLADGFVLEPKVAVAVERYRSQRVFITGEVRQPGALELSGSISLLEALARAGSTTEYAGIEAVIARPRGAASARQAQGRDDGESEIIRVDLRELRSGRLAENVPLRSGDTVFIPRVATVFVLGEVRSPGEYPLLPGLRVIQVLSRAGGLTERGSIKRLRIIRFENDVKQELKAKLEDFLQPGDVLLVHERLL